MVKQKFKIAIPLLNKTQLIPHLFFTINQTTLEYDSKHAIAGISFRFHKGHQEHAVIKPRNWNFQYVFQTFSSMCSHFN